MPQALTIPKCCEKTNQFFRDNKLESFTPRELERYVRSASHQFEKKIFSTIFKQLSNDTINLFDDLLDNDIDVPNDEVINGVKDIKLRHIKKDFAGAKLKNVNFSIDKLNYIRKISLPIIEIFDTFSRKLTQKYYMRIVAELPSNIKEHEPEIRYATMGRILLYPFTIND